MTGEKQSLTASEPFILKILITSGGCSEPIDRVRSLTNTSTGQTGAALADYFFRQDAHVTLLKSKTAQAPQSPVLIHEFQSFSDLAELLKTTLSLTNQEKTGRPYDAVIHAAAVSDFSIDFIRQGSKEYPAPLKEKLSSTETNPSPVEIRLKPNPKLLSLLPEFSANPNLLIIGFKLTDTPTEKDRKQAVSRLFQNSSCSYIVHNDLSEIQEDRHPFHLYTTKTRNKAETTKTPTPLRLQKSSSIQNPEELAKILYTVIQKEKNSLKPEPL